MRIGIVASSGGSAFAGGFRALQSAGIVDRFLVATDRPCGIEDVCRRFDLKTKRFESMNNAQFSTTAASWFRANGGVDFIVLFFMRFVTEELFDRSPVYNIHPSLLPAFPGFGALQKARRRSFRYLGATLHRVDKSIDGGIIVGQSCIAMNPIWTRPEVEKRSYLQKVYLFLLLIDLARHGAEEGLVPESVVTHEKWKPGTFANPAICDPKIATAFSKLAEEEGLPEGLG